MNTEGISIMEIIKENPGVFYTILGTMIGAVVSFLSTYFFQRREIKWKLDEKIISKRILEHEILLKFITELNLTIGFDTTENKVRTCVGIFRSPDLFMEWNNRFTFFISKAFIWFSKPILEELFFFNGYIETLKEYFVLNEINEIQLELIGEFLKDDLEKIGKNFSKLIGEYYAKDLSKVVNKKDLQILDEKPSRNETKEHYKNFDFFLHRRKLNKKISTDQTLSV